MHPRPGRHAAAAAAALLVVVALLAGCGDGGQNPSRSWTEQEVRFTSGPNRLFGVLTIPAGPGPHAAVVLLSGSDRGGVDTPLLGVHARTLAESGIAVLRYDPPGVGRSGGVRRFETLRDRATEAIAATDFLRSRRDVDGNRIGLWGESQGGWVTQMAAAASPRIAFIVSVSGSGVSVAEQQVFSVEAQTRAAGGTPGDVARAGLFVRLLIDWQLTHPRYRAQNEDAARRLGRGPWTRFAALVYGPRPPAPQGLARVIALLTAIRGEPWARFLALDTEYLPALRAIAPGQAETARAAAERSLLVDPRRFLTRVRCPVLALFGEHDVLVPATRSAERYRRYLRQAGNPDVTIVVLPSAGHSLDDFGPAYWDLLIGWLTRRTAQPEP